MASPRPERKTRRAVLRGGGTDPARAFAARPEAGPDTLMTATPARPAPDAKAQIVAPVAESATVEGVGIEGAQAPGAPPGAAGFVGVIGVGEKGSMIDRRERPPLGAAAR